MSNKPGENSYRVVTRIKEKPDRMGRKLTRPQDACDDCSIPCTGHFWGKPCDDDEYENCDKCVCNHCDHCPCKEEAE